jgi:hypothetical protein
VTSVLHLLLPCCITGHYACEDIFLRIPEAQVRGGHKLPLARKQRVVLFLHVAKCGGTSVREIFRTRGWSMTHYSLTQQFKSDRYRSNRLLRSIGQLLAANHTHIFAEWHFDYNLLCRRFRAVFAPCDQT